MLVGSHAVGELVGSIGSVAELLERVRAFPTWMRTERDLGRMEEFLLPIPVVGSGKGLRECVLVSVRSTRAGERLGEAAELRVLVQDRLVPGGGDSERGRVLALNVDGLVRGSRRHSGSENVCVEQGEFPTCESSMDGTACVLGLIVARLCVHARIACLDATSEEFAKRARTGLRLVAFRSGSKWGARCVAAIALPGFVFGIFEDGKRWPRHSGGCSRWRGRGL